MLLELQVQDFALIDKLRLSFNNGLNILTGETGAGKSLIIDSVNFVLGERTSKDIIRTGFEKTYVEAIFDNIDNTELSTVMNGYGIEEDDGVIILSRELSNSGRSICRVNGKIVTTSMLKNIGDYLMDIHGQHEHQSLLNEDNHLDLLDMFGGFNLVSLKEKVYNFFHEMVEIRKELNSYTGDDLKRERKLDLLNFQLKEIDDAKLKCGEEEDLLNQRSILNNANKLFSALSDSYSILYEDNEDSKSVYDRLGSVLSELESIVNIDEKLKTIYNSIEGIYYQLEGAIDDIRTYRDKIDFSPETIDEVEQRLDVISRLKRKYGKSVADILDYRQKVFNDIQDMINSEEKIAFLKNKLEKKLTELDNSCLELSTLRKDIAKDLERSIVNELKFLCIEKALFSIEINTHIKDGHVFYSEKGTDTVKFLISTNPGELPKPLSKIASGGEMSRIMLAIKTVLADSDRIPSLIFDEIDTGISGRAAQAVAEKLCEISKTHQVICVTHLPQIASMADMHFYISKQTIGDKTNTHIKMLNNDEKVEEIARMLGGVKLTELTLKHADEMISMARALKN